MNKDLKAKWVEALRSGDYKQGTQLLKNQGEDECTYCCLGVLCVIAGKDTDAGSYRWLNKVTKGYYPFVLMNDDDGKSFAEIADYIEANL
jgi:hypothetical protein